MFGLMAYPAQGIFKSIAGRKGSDPVLQAKCGMVDDYASASSDKMEAKQVGVAFDGLLVGK
jgi:hypothetical protein